MQGQPKIPFSLLPGHKWLALADQVRELADLTQSPDTRSALCDLAINYTAIAAGLDASGGPERTGMLCIEHS